MPNSQCAPTIRALIATSGRSNQTTMVEPAAVATFKCSNMDWTKPSASWRCGLVSTADPAPYVGAFLIGRGPSAAFQVAVQPLFMLDYAATFPSLRIEPGLPKGPATEATPGVFVRHFANLTVRFDCNHFNASFEPAGSLQSYGNLKSDDHDHLAPMAATDLLVEFRPSPLVGVDSPRPRFSWSLSAVERDVSSAAYQIIVSNRDDHDSASATTWDSGKVASEASHLVECGVALKPDTRYEWKVRWWATTSGSPSPFSAVALLHTGLFSTSDWHGAIPIGSVNTTADRNRPVPVTSDQIEDGVCAKAGACRMINTTEIKGVMGYFGGDYVEVHSAKTVAACLAVCQADPACKQASWDPYHTSPTGFAKCATFNSITPSYVATAGVATGWVKLSGRFLAGENGHAPGVLCPVKGYPASCTWFETFADSSKHFVTDCDSYPKACGPAQLGCWPDFDSQLPIKQANASYLRGLTLGANYSCKIVILSRFACHPSR